MSHLFDNFSEMEEMDGAVLAALLRQDAALVLLDRLRSIEPFRRRQEEHGAAERRAGRRWPLPGGVSVEMHDGTDWRKVHCPDIGAGGARVQRLPEWANGPTPIRLRIQGGVSVLALADVMWREDGSGQAGLRFEFTDGDEAEYWSAALADAVLTAHAIG